MNKLAAVSFVLLALVAAAPAHAGALDRQPVAAEVRLDTVDFQDARSVKALYQRLERTAWSVCDSRINDRTVRRQDAACRREAVEKAVAQLSKPMLTAMHQTRSQTMYARGY